MDSPANSGQTNVSGKNFPGKKVYVKPSLQIYGSIEKITYRSSVTVTSGDNGLGKNNRLTGG